MRRRLPPYVHTASTKPLFKVFFVVPPFLGVPRSGYSKRGSPNWGCLLRKLCFCDSLELLDHPNVPEPPDIVIKATRISDGVAKFESKGMRWLLVEDITHTDG